jgi:phospholipase/carboxylesterase
MHTKKIISAGRSLEKAQKAIIMIHGRGGTAKDILSLGSHLDLTDFALLAPQATNNSWYPLSFLAPPPQNEPWLSSALDIIAQTVADIEKAGIGKDHIYLLGFSQGACLTLEYITRHAARYGGAIAFTGGLIGDKIYTQHYTGDFAGTPVFIGTSNPDPHVPVERVYASVNIIRQMNAIVTEKIYENMGHTINQDEIAFANKVLSGSTPGNH